MKSISVNEKLKLVLDPKRAGIKARLFVSREDGITVYDTVQNQTTTPVSALVSGVWQAAEALMGLVHSNQEIMEFRLSFDTSSRGLYLFPFQLSGKNFLLGAIYEDCLNPGLLKRQVAMIREEMDFLFSEEKQTKPVKTPVREGYLFQEISDEEINRLFAVSGI